MSEEWRKVNGYPAYEVSNTGKVRSVDRYVRIRGNGRRPLEGMELRQYEDRLGYRFVKLSSMSDQKTLAVHRLVAKAFIPNPEGKPMVNHIDCNPSNNNAENLEWVTAQENVDWMYTCGRESDHNARPIRATNIKTGESVVFQSSVEAARHGFQRPSIWRQMTGEYSHHKGYKFEYAE